MVYRRMRQYNSINKLVLVKVRSSETYYYRFNPKSIIITHSDERWFLSPSGSVSSESLPTSPDVSAELSVGGVPPCYEEPPPPLGAGAGEEGLASFSWE